MNKSVTIAIVYYDDINIDFFMKSIYSALSQLYNKFVLKIYYDSDNEYYNIGTNLINVRLPDNIRNNPSKIREYIVKDCDTEYLSFWDSDDVYTVDRISNQIYSIENSNASLVYSNFGFITDSDLILDNDFFTLIGFHDRKINILDENYIGLGISTFRVETLRKLLPFPSINRLDWWINIKFHQNKYIICNTGIKILGYYRIHGSSLSRIIRNYTKSDIIKEINEKLKIYKNIENNNKIDKRISYFNKKKNNDNYLEKMLKKEKHNPWGGLSEYKE